MTFSGKFQSARLIVAIIMALGCGAHASAGTVAVLEFGLHDLTLNPDVKAETERTALLRGLLADRLSGTHNHNVPDNPERAAIEAAKGQGYLFDRPRIAAEIGKDVGADWVVNGRLHKASFLFVYLKAQLINTNTGAVASDFVVEIKGHQKKLTAKGIEALALQIHDAIEQLESK